MMTQPLALVTNDDGVDSAFLHLLISALAEAGFAVVIAAPAQEQSWIGRALSRRRDVPAEAVTIGPAQGWKLDGTPTDCVNIALGHLLPTRPSVIVSGINIGYNTSMPLLLSSGTLAGAIEGAHWGIPAIASSQFLPPDEFRAAARGHGQLPPEPMATVRAAAVHTARLAMEIAGQPNPDLHVHNLNFPYPTAPDTPIFSTRPARIEPRCLFAGGSPETAYTFAYQSPPEPPSDFLTDRAAIRQGWISHSILNFSALS